MDKSDNVDRKIHAVIQLAKYPAQELLHSYSTFGCNPFLDLSLSHDHTITSSFVTSYEFRSSTANSSVIS